MVPTRSQSVTVDGRTLRLSNLDKVLYPATGTTKADVLSYYAAVAGPLIHHAAGRPATRKRWVHGVGTPVAPGEVFFQKNIDDNAPDWVPRTAVRHRDHTNSYPRVDDLATLTWLGQIAALEIHVPQWRFDTDGAAAAPDRLVLDLDPGEGVGLAECAEVALLARPILQGMGLEPFPVTSGAKGLHLYCALAGGQSSAQVSAVAHELARALEADHPGLAVSDMKKSLRSGRVLVDWSQNSATKTTVAPYSLRGGFEPTVAAPRSWEELEAGGLDQLDPAAVMARIAASGDLLAPATVPAAVPVPADAGGASAGASAGEAPADRLSTYRSMRDALRTPEPVPAATGPAGGTGFVIQEHHARRLHWDFRLEREGVLVSWALPKGPPLTPDRNHLAVQTEDHPLEYGTFEGDIPAGEYGGGHVSIWDAGTYELEKWRDGKEVICTLHGRPDGGLARAGAAVRRYALISTGGVKGKNNWLIHLMKDQPVQQEDAPTVRTVPPDGEHPEERTSGGFVPPMLATPSAAQTLPDPDDWAYELKWDGVRCIATVSEGGLTLWSRNGVDITAVYPELGDLAEHVRADTAVLDGEIVALDPRGRPDFGLLQQRMTLTDAQEIEEARGITPVRLVLFDLPALEGNDLTGFEYRQRRELLERAVDEAGDHHVQVPAALDATFEEAVVASRQLGLEGIVAKRLSGDYRPGARSPSWVKIRHLRTQEVVVVGWRPGNGGRAATLGSLLVAVPDGDTLRYVGRVGSGLGERDLRAARERLDGLARSTAPLDDVPPAEASDAHWVSPSLVAEVRYSGRTGGGRLRHPVWRGWRPDKTPDDITDDVPSTTEPVP